MKRHYLPLMTVAFIFICLPAVAGAVDSPPYSETLPASAFQAGGVDDAVRMLVNEGVPASVIIRAAIRNGASYGDIVGALLAAGVSPEEVVRAAMQTMSAENALDALHANGISPGTVLAYLIQGGAKPDTIYETCGFMLNRGYSQADVLTALSDAGADRDTVLQVVRRYNIPPATVVAVFQPLAEGLDGFGHVFSRHSLPQPALFAMGLSRISVSDAFNSRGTPVISPMIP